MASALGRTVFATVLAAFVASAAVSCGDDEMKIEVKYAPGFVKDGNTMSFFGVFRDGRMSPETWDDLGPRFSAALHKESCDLAVSNAMRAMNNPLFTRIDDIARSEGITDELLDKFASGATGDSILVITIAGRPPKADAGTGHGHDRHTWRPALPALPSMAVTSQDVTAQMRGGGRRRGMPPRTTTNNHGHVPDVFEIAASLFSLRQHQSVALVEMTYTGASEEQAIAKFLEKLTAAFPGATCRDWNPEVVVSADDLRGF